MKTFSILLIGIFLSGCSIFDRFEDQRPPPVVITNKTLLAYQCPPPPQVDNVDSRPIQWDVISRLELDAVILELLTELGIEDEDMFIINQAIGDFFFHPEDEVIWALNPDDYADLGRNTADYLAGLKQFKQVALHYKKCISDSEKAVLEQNVAESESDSD